MEIADIVKISVYGAGILGWAFALRNDFNLLKFKIDSFIERDKGLLKNISTHISNSSIHTPKDSLFNFVPRQELNVRFGEIDKSLSRIEGKLDKISDAFLKIGKAQSTK